jgi:hypothetical protein
MSPPECGRNGCGKIRGVSLRSLFRRLTLRSTTGTPQRGVPTISSALASLTGGDGAARQSLPKEKPRSVLRSGAEKT